MPVSLKTPEGARGKSVKHARGEHRQAAARPLISAERQPNSFAASVTSLPSVLPNLRSALRLYALVILSTTVLILGLLYNVDVVFLRLSAALLVFCGFTLVALLAARKPVFAVFGRLPSLPVLVLGFFTGVVAWTPATWLLLILTQFLGAGYGNLPPHPTTTASAATIALLFVGIIPFSEGFLFFGYFLSAARGLGIWRGVGLTSLLFGIFGMVADQYGLSAIPAYMLLGAAGSALTVWSGSAWLGILVLSGFSVGQQLIGTTIVAVLLKDQYSDVLSFNWIVAAVLFAMATFALTQLVRAFRSRRPLSVAAQPGRAWWLPLAIIVVLSFIVLGNEIQTRRRNPARLAPTIVTPSAAVAPPVALPNPTISSAP